MFVWMNFEEYGLVGGWSDWGFCDDFLKNFVEKLRFSGGILIFRKKTKIEKKNEKFFFTFFWIKKKFFSWNTEFLKTYRSFGKLGITSRIF